MPEIHGNSSNMPSSEWTFETLYTMLSRQVEDLAMRMDERHATQQEEIKTGDHNLKQAQENGDASIHLLIDNRLEDLNRSIAIRGAMLDERFTSQQKAVETARAADQESVDKALGAAEKAVDRRQDQADREFHEHLAQVREENTLAFINNDKNIGERFDSSDKAISKAETAAEKRFESVNEFRAQLNDQAVNFMTRTEAAVIQQRNDERAEDMSKLISQAVPRIEVAGANEQFAKRLQDLTDRINRSEGKGQGMSALYGWIVAAIGLLATIIVIANAIYGGN